MTSVLSFIWYSFFDRAAMFMTVLVFIGQLLAKKGFVDSLSGGLKAYIGYVVYQTATGGLYNIFQPIMMGMRQVMGMNIIVNDDSLGAGTLTHILESFGRTTSLQMAAMAMGFVIAIILVLFKKQTKFRSMIIQAHILSGQAIDMVPILLVMFPSMNDAVTILVTGLYLGVKWCMLSNLTVEPAQDLTDGANMVVGHTQMIVDRIAYEYGRHVERKAKKNGKEVKKFDNIELPGFLSIFNDMYVASFVVMLIYFTILMMLIGKEAMMTIDTSLGADDSFALYIFHSAGKFPVYLVILLTGMRMFVAELTTAFSGISEKILPDVLPGIDCAAFYGFVTDGQVVTISFIIGSLSMTLFTFLGMLAGLPFVCIVGFVPMMFDSATAGIFGYQRGGVKGLVFGVELCAIADVFLAGIAACVIGFDVYGGVGFQVDNAITLAIFSPIWKYLGWIGYALVIIAMLAVPHIQYALNKKGYWLASEDWEKYKEVMGEDL
jgi:ascorbate PTS system EIIC component